MYLILLMAMATSVLSGFQMELTNLNCNTRQCSKNIEHLSREVLKINWKPISVFSEEATRFR